MMSIHRYLVLTIFSFGFMVACQIQEQEQMHEWVAGVEAPDQILDGTWSFMQHPPEAFWQNPETLDWKSIEVPGECAMQGFPIRHDEPFLYGRQITIPEDFAGQRITLRFDGVYSYARLFVNGQYIRDHHGGFTRWEADISAHIAPGSTAWLLLEVTDRADEISYASGYAKHQIGGILRSVYLQARPAGVPNEIRIETEFDDRYEDAILTVSGKLSEQEMDANLRLELSDATGQSIALQSTASPLRDTTFTIMNSIRQPWHWTAENPYLYDLVLTYAIADKPKWKKRIRVGFREVEASDNELLVNGKPVHLRGACRHDIHPLLGRVSTPHYDSLDVQLAKGANMNFIRTSHYPPTEHFLALCDEYGIYVEDETAVCFVGSHRTREYYPGSSESDTAFTQRYMVQLQEMVRHHRNHPSVIFWSIGNENTFGSNFKRSYDWVKTHDTTRPVIFSYPGQVPDSVKAYDLLSMHYPPVSGTMDQYGIQTQDFGYEQMPVIFDEWAHVACYNNPTVKEDPNVRDFWGRSLDSMWQKLYDADGGLGGAIWGMIDETFMLPDDLPGFQDWWGQLDASILPADYLGPTVGYGAWGIVDTWRRKKPEWYNTRKAYSPVRILQTTLTDPGTAGLNVPVYNRFDHTNLDQITATWTYQGVTQDFPLPNLPPHTQGSLQVPLSTWQKELPIQLDFYDMQGDQLDSYVLSQTREREVLGPAGSVQMDTSGASWILTGDAYTLYLDPTTGLFQQLEMEDKSVRFQGPYLQLRTQGAMQIYSNYEITEHVGDWQLQKLEIDGTTESADIRATGKYASGPEVTWRYQPGKNGRIQVSYSVDGMPEGMIRDAGVYYHIDAAFDSIQWHRRGYWSSYPEEHLSSLTGTVPIYLDRPPAYRQPPDRSWPMSGWSWYYDGMHAPDTLLTYTAKSSKESVYTYQLHHTSGVRIAAESDGRIACRLEYQDAHLKWIIANVWDYVDLDWGNFEKEIQLSGSWTGEHVLQVN